MLPLKLPLALTIAAAALLAPAGAMGVQSVCDQSVALIPQLAGASFLSLPAGPEGASVNTGGQAAQSVAFSADGTKAYVASQGLLQEVDAATGTTLRTLSLTGYPQTITASPDGTTLYLTLSAGVAFLDLGTFSITANVTLDDGFHVQSPTRAALSPDGASLYATANWGGTSFGLFKIDTATRQVVRRSTSGPIPTGIAVTADGSKVLATRTNFSAKLDVFDANTLASLASVNVDRPAGGVDILGTIAVGSDSSLAYVADVSGQDVVAVDVSAGTVLRRMSGFQSVSALGINWDGTRLLVAGIDGSYSQVAWDVADPRTGAISASGVTTGAAGGFNGSLGIAMCPRFVAAPPGDATPPAVVVPNASGATATCPSSLATALDRPRVVRAGGRAVVQQSVRLDQAGRYTFIYEDPSGHRVPLLKGSQLSTRVLGKTFTAPVRTTQGPAERLVVSGRLARASARGVTLRVIYRGPDGVLCGVHLQ
ncbi:MAG: YncE family protein [Thermoleophilia bacterium]